MNWDWITDTMAVGTWPENATDVAELKGAGFTHVLNVREIDDIPEVKAAFTYLWNPTADWTPEAALGNEPKPLEWFKASLDFWYRLGVDLVPMKLYCHCSAGVNRSATTVWMFLRMLQLKAEDCSWILDHNRPWAALGEILDRTWRNDAQNALVKLGYIKAITQPTALRPLLEGWGRKNNQLLKQILAIVERIDARQTDIKSLGITIDQPIKQ